MPGSSSSLPHRLYGAATSSPPPPQQPSSVTSASSTTPTASSFCSLHHSDMSDARLHSHTSTVAPPLMPGTTVSAAAMADIRSDMTTPETDGVPVVTSHASTPVDSVPLSELPTGSILATHVGHAVSPSAITLGSFLFTREVADQWGIYARPSQAGAAVILPSPTHVHVDAPVIVVSAEEKKGQTDSVHGGGGADAVPSTDRRGSSEGRSGSREGRRAEPLRRRPALPTTPGIRSSAPTAAVDAAARNAAVHDHEMNPHSTGMCARRIDRSPRHRLPPPPTSAGAATPPRPQPQQEEEEELAQLARSLRSQIAGEPFLLTTSFGSPGGGSRPSSSFSEASAGSGVDGRRSSHYQLHHHQGRRSQEENHPSAKSSSGCGTRVRHVSPIVIGRTNSAVVVSSPSVIGRWPSDKSAPSPSPLPLSTSADLSQTRRRGGDAALLTSPCTPARTKGEEVVMGALSATSTPLLLPPSSSAVKASHDAVRVIRSAAAAVGRTSYALGSDGGPPASQQTASAPSACAASVSRRVHVADEKRSQGGGEAACVADRWPELEDATALRRRLLTEDFFSNPLRKLQRDGQCPWKLITSLLLCLLLLLQVVWYQVPLAKANESMRRAITERFLEDDYVGKAHGDVVTVPTVWMESLYAAIHSYVEVYYDFSNSSPSNMNYYYDHRAAPGNGSLPTVREGRRRRTKTAAPPIAMTDIAPVLMRVLVDTYSRREGVQPPRLMHSVPTTATTTNTSADRQGKGEAEATGGSWWRRWASLAPHAIAGVVPEEQRDTQWLAFEVDAAHPLGPFAKYHHAARRLRKAQQRQQSPVERQAELDTLAAAATAEEMEEEETDGGGGEMEGRSATSAARREVTLLRSPSDGELTAAVDDYAMAATLAMVCSPRVEDLTGRPYRPCATVPSAGVKRNKKMLQQQQRSALSASLASTADAPLLSASVPEYSLMDNVRTIQLQVTLRHAVTSRSPSSLPAATYDRSGRASTMMQRLASETVLDPVRYESCVFQWMIEKTIHIHPGGLVETQLHVHTRVWPVGATIRHLFQPAQLMVELLLVLAVTELLLRVRALCRMMRYRRRLRREQAAFYARQLTKPADETAALLPRRHGSAGEGSAEGMGEVPQCAESVVPSNRLRFPNSLKASASAAQMASLPYDWGFPASPVGLRPTVLEGAEDGLLFPDHLPLPLPPAAASVRHATANTNYGATGSTLQAPRDGDRDGGGGDGGVPAGKGSDRTIPLLCQAAATHAAVRPPTELGALLVPDSSLSTIAAPAPPPPPPFSYGSAEEVSIPGAEGWTTTPRIDDRGCRRTEGEEKHAQAEERSDAASGLLPWMRRGVRDLASLVQHGTTHSSSSHHLIPSTLHPKPVPNNDSSFFSFFAVSNVGAAASPYHLPLPLRPATTTITAVPPAASPYSPFSSPMRTGAAATAAPLTPQLTELIMERTYVDVRSTWRHHLQQSMGAGWHWVGMVSALLTLSYSLLFLAPLLPSITVVQDGNYDALTRALLGLAALTACVLLLSYLRFFPTLYFPILASIHVLPKLFLFTLCVAPLFFGFVLFFVIAFGHYSEGHFRTLGWASLGLYFMTYGDSLLDTVAFMNGSPHATTVAIASVLVVAFTLLFMMIMLNIAMTITQHEWLRLRRRFGAALSGSGLLFSVRSRGTVKAESVEAIRAQLEVLWLMLAQEEATAAAAAASSSGDARGISDAPVKRSSSLSMSSLSVSTSRSGEEEGSQRRRHRHCSDHHERDHTMIGPAQNALEGHQHPAVNNRSSSGGRGGDTLGEHRPGSNGGGFFEVSAATAEPSDWDGR